MKEVKVLFFFGKEDEVKKKGAITQVDKRWFLPLSNHFPPPPPPPPPKKDKNRLCSESPLRPEGQGFATRFQGRQVKAHH